MVNDNALIKELINCLANDIDTLFKGLIKLLI